MSVTIWQQSIAIRQGGNSGAMQVCWLCLMHSWSLVCPEAVRDWVQQQHVALAKLSTAAEGVTQVLPGSKSSHRQPDASQVCERLLHQLQKTFNVLARL